MGGGENVEQLFSNYRLRPFITIDNLKKRNFRALKKRQFLYSESILMSDQLQAENNRGGIFGGIDDF